VLAFAKQDYALGVAIILLTVTIMLVLYPLTATAGALDDRRCSCTKPRSSGSRRSSRTTKQKMNEEVMKYLPGAQDQPARRVPAPAGPAPHLLRAVPRAA
jgi:membrane protein insertase Oxa1/YidC/SpoIIIJ